MRSPPAFLWHALPLHYVPFLLYTKVLCAQAELKRRGYPVAPRRTAARRDRKLHLDNYVHLSPQADTPLLCDKSLRGYPHALIAFDAELLTGDGVALCRYNAKSWRHREDFTPITDAEAQAEVWREWQAGRYPSLEVLVPQALPLMPHAQVMHLPDDRTLDWLVTFKLLLHDGAAMRLVASPDLFPGLTAYNAAGLENYLQTCQAAGHLLPPPDLPFD